MTEGATMAVRFACMIEGGVMIEEDDEILRSKKGWNIVMIENKSMNLPMVSIFMKPSGRGSYSYFPNNFFFPTLE